MASEWYMNVYEICIHKHDICNVGNMRDNKARSEIINPCKNCNSYVRVIEQNAQSVSILFMSSLVLLWSSKLIIIAIAPVHATI